MKKWTEGNLPRRGLAMVLCLCMVLSLVPVYAFAEEEPAGSTVQETTVTEETVPETAVPETTVPETTVPEETVPEETVPEATVPEETVPETTVPEVTVPETTVPEETVPETTVPEVTVPEDTVPEETGPETTAPSHDCEGELEPVAGDQGEPLWVCPVCGAVLDAQGNALPTLLPDCSAYGAQAVGVEIDEINFPDDNFRAIVRQFDKDGDRALSSAEIAAVDKIDCSGRGIRSLTGIEYFTALTELDCADNQLTELVVSSNTALNALQCSHNQLTELDVSSNTKLTSLDCAENQLTKLVVSSNTKLTLLYCADNQLTELDVSSNTALNGLSCSGNQLTSLDVSSNTKLTYLDCAENQLTELVVSSNTALNVLSCYNNQLTSLDVSSSNTALNVLSCYNNQLTSLDVSSNTALNELWCQRNHLTSLDVSSNTALQRLECSANALTSLDLSKNTALRGANFYGQKASGDYIQRDGAYLLDMAKVVGTSNLSRVSVTSGGTYDDSTGMVTLNAPTGEENTIEVNYNYTVGFKSNTMPVTLTLTPHITHSFDENGDCSCGLVKQVPYVDAKGNSLGTQVCTVITKDTKTLTAGWYVASGSVTTAERLVCDGSVNLILEDGCELIATGGIQVEDSNALTIYAQSTAEATMGKLTTQNVNFNYAAIGGNDEESGGKITINGGFVTATSASGAAIGGGHSGGPGGNGGTITITGGVVKAKSERGAAIGGGNGGEYGGDGGKITITGGVVKAKSEHGAAIGGGGHGAYGGDGGEVTISGGIVRAESNYGAAIGGGHGGAYGGSGDKITITGGIVHAESESGAAIGGGYGRTAIGGSGIFSTGTNGNAVIFAGSIADQSGKGSWGGVIFEGGAGKVYGSPTLPLGLPIPEKTSLTLDMNSNSLTFAQGTGIALNSGSTLKLSGPGSFPNGVSVTGGTLGDLLAEGWAYRQNGKYVPVDGVAALSGATSLSEITVTITGQPEDVTMTYGETKFLSVTAEPVTSGSTVSYQWYLDGSALTGETQSTLSLSTLNVGTYQVYCAVTCDGFTVDSDTAKVTVTPGPSYLDLTGEHDFDNQADVTIGGVAYPIRTDNGRYVILPDTGDLLTIYTYANVESEDVHQTYPNSMSVYRITRTDNGATVEKIDALDNLLQYSGCSIRISGKQGIRMITSLTKANKAALKKGGLAGFTLEEYGTVVQWADTLGGQSLTLETGKHNYAYKKGKADPVFANSGDLTQYTNVLVGFSLDQCANDIVMRPYIVLKNAEGQTVTLYGGTVTRSIGYIAYQNRATFNPGTAAYQYVWNIIHAVYGDQYDSEYQK